MKHTTASKMHKKTISAVPIELVCSMSAGASGSTCFMCVLTSASMKSSIVPCCVPPPNAPRREANAVPKQRPPTKPALE
eukprot:CAMPEP_0117501816 /NCGR_PEP_ID=MMETSP0784-20121206/23495_1 /TAXON_ID=39447 /ORGANISM="" /LENGTH=78 /DNA_ID=CAMNT_0005297085 /DNA_START=184 /DNA_END=417 /DNA_ORIENTATION=+